MGNIVSFAKLGTFGRFSNQQFQIAATCGIARRNGFDWALPAWRNYDALNFGQPDLDVQERFVNHLPVYNGPDLPEHGVAFGYQDVRLTQSVSLLGHFQSERYFDHAMDEVKFYFRMKGEPPTSDYCGVHYRAGDYGAAPTKYKPQGNAFHPRMALNYYEPAMALFGSGQKFLVFSDDLDAAKEMFGDRVEYSREADYLDDFRALKKCRHFIISNSSYSLMAAILGDADDKQVVCPRPWFGAAYKGQLDEADIPSPGWYVVDWETQEIKQAA